MSLSFKRAEQIRLELTAQQQKEIRDLYQSVADDIADRLSVPKRVPSDALRQWYLRDLQKQVNAALEEAGKTTESTIRSNAEKVAQGVVDCNADWLKSVGMPVGSAFSWVPTDIVTSVATGQIYEGPWSLSGAIWADVQAQQRDIQTIIARGIAENKSAFDIAKDLEKYVDPSAVKPWDWSKVYPGVRRQIDYSAQRLARTMVSHAYQQAFVRTTQKNPFVTKYKWEASNSDRVCELCQERDGKLFSKDDLPLDHPNGMCTYTAVIEDSMDQVADRLADWANGAEDPELDTWAKDMYGDQYSSAMSILKVSDDTPKALQSVLGPKGEPFTMFESLHGTNPRYKDHSYPAKLYHNNCQRCVSVYELKRRGYDVVAKAFDGSYPKFSSVFQFNSNDFSSYVTQNANSRFSPYMGLESNPNKFGRTSASVAKKIISTMDNWGPGSRGIMFVVWSGGSSSHVVNLENINGEVWIADGQSGRNISGIDAITAYMKNTMPGSTELYRVDHLPLCQYEEGSRGIATVQSILERYTP